MITFKRRSPIERPFERPFSHPIALPIALPIEPTMNAPATSPVTQSCADAFMTLAAGHGAQVVIPSPWGPQFVSSKVNRRQADPARGSETLLVCPLPDLAALEATGADAAKFLHGQLTNDVEHLPVGAAQWTGYCSPKGRLLASFIQWREHTTDGDTHVLALDATLAEPLRARLSMFVLRAKATLKLAKTRVALGLIGADPSAALSRLGMACPAAMQVIHGPDGLVAIGLPPVASERTAAPRARVMLWMPADRLAAVVDAMGDAACLADTADWRLGEVESGMPRVFTATSGAFVPQMINFELVGGVNFKKGCYPGQEVVARSQYLGKLKRRMFLARSTQEGLPGTDVHAPEGTQPCGMIVSCAPSPDGDWRVLYECPIAEAEAGGLTMAGGAALTPLRLPYAIPAA